MGRGSGREARGGRGREKRPDHPRFANSALTGATFQKDARGGQRVGSERGEWPYLGFVLMRGNSLPKATAPPGVCSPLCVTGNSGEPSDPLQTQFALEISVGFSFFSEALRCQDPQASNNDAFQTTTSNCLAVISVLLNRGKLG